MIAPGANSEERAPRVLVSVAVVGVVAVDFLYLELIRSQDGSPSDQPLVVPFVAGYLALAAVALLSSLALSHSLKAALRTGAAAGLLVLAVLSGFSIGAAVLVPAALAIAAAAVTVTQNPTRRAVAASLTGGALALALLVAGFWVAWSYIQCPSSGESGGSTATHTYYFCENGTLTTP